MPLRNLAAFVPLVTILFLGPSLGAEEFNFYFKTSPPLELLRPWHEPATLALLVTAPDGRPLNQAWVQIRLDAPKAGRFFSTDFPLLEGSRLTEMRLPLRQGKTEWKYLFPIRGEYQMTVDVFTADGKNASKTLKFGIRENKKKWLFLGLFMVGLFAFGMVAGMIFTPVIPSRTRRVSACLLLIIGCLAADVKIRAGQEAASQANFGWLEIDPATVGNPSRVRWRLGGETSSGQPTALTLTIAHLEKGKTVFSIDRVPVPGEFTMDFHFPDGAEYRVTSIAGVTGAGTVRTEKNLTVAGAEPPSSAMVPALTVFLLVIALGLGAGRWTKRRTHRRDTEGAE